MRLMRRALFLIPLLALSACGNDAALESATESTPEILSESAQVTPFEPVLLLPQGAHQAALWSEKSQTERWTAAVLSVVRARIRQFEKARDIDKFCPGYREASVAQKEACWVRLVSAVSKFESGFNPRDTYREANGRMSIGLLALSTGECPEAKTSSALKEPLGNLLCGTRMMAELIDRDGIIENPPPHRGAAAYWSVLRTPYGHGKHKHGKVSRIIPLTKQYRTFEPI
ncbi:MAG: hypothetical protein ACXWQO_15590 [Bdellovibrionota bacterium]